MAQEHIDALRKARARLVSDRRATAETLSEPFERAKSIDARDTFVALQKTIEAIDEAIEDEEGLELSRRQAAEIERERAGPAPGPENAFGVDDQ
jgi:hypothetical protein